MMHWLLFLALMLMGIRQTHQVIVFAKANENFFCAVEILFTVAVFIAAGEVVKSWIN